MGDRSTIHGQQMQYAFLLRAVLLCMSLISLIVSSDITLMAYPPSSSPSLRRAASGRIISKAPRQRPSKPRKISLCLTAILVSRDVIRLARKVYEELDIGAILSRPDPHVSMLEEHIRYLTIVEVEGKEFKLWYGSVNEAIDFPKNHFCGMPSASGKCEPQSRYRFTWNARLQSIARPEEQYSYLLEADYYPRQPVKSKRFGSSTRKAYSNRQDSLTEFGSPSRGVDDRPAGATASQNLALQYRLDAVHVTLQEVI